MLSWWGRWDLNPGSPAPQAGILNHSRGSGTRIHSSTRPDTLARRRPQQPTNYNDSIINTLINATNSGKAKTTIRSISYSLKQLNRNADLKNPSEVKAYIANTTVCNATKIKLCFAYNWFCQTNNIEWVRPKYKWERKIPIIPTTANIDKIISASTRKYATIFTILKETGLEGHELATITRKHIDTEQRARLALTSMLP